MSRTASDRYQRQVLELVKQPGNNQCADCKTSNPRWASWDQGVFLCVKCASMHRKIGSHITKVKSLTLDTWTKEQVENMRKLGNVKVNSLLNPDERRNPPPPPDSDDSRNSELERFVRNKYEYKVYQDFDHPALPSPAPSPQIRSPLPTQYSGITSLSNVPPPPRRSDSQPIYSPPPGPPPPASSNPAPSLPTRTSAFSPPASSPAPPLPSRSATLPAPQQKLPKSVRFPSAPPVQIPSPPDSDDEDSYTPTRQSRHRSLAPSSTRSILVRTPANAEIPIDWAALTREPVWSTMDEDGDEDVPLQALGALGMKGAQVGLVGIPTNQGQGFTPMAMYGANPGQSQQGTMGGVKPLMPQFTGSAKGYLHQLHAGTFQQSQPQNGIPPQQQQQPQMLVPQMTGSVSKNYGHHQGGGTGGGMDGDSFMRMFQPPSSASAGGGSDFQQQYQQTQYFQATNSNAFSNQFQQQQAPTQQQAPIRTNPFTQFAQPPPQTHQSQQQTQTQLQPPPTSIWDDLVSLSPSPSSTPQPQPSPQPLRPQLTGFVPSSSFGQQLARESSPAPAQTPSSSQFLTPNGGGNENRSASPSSQQPQQTSPLTPQYTGFVPSSSFGQSMQNGGAPPQPLQPQRTGFVPSSSFGQQLAKDLGGGGGGGSTINGSTAGGGGGDTSGFFELSASNNSKSSNPPQGNRQPSPGLFDFDLFNNSSSSNSTMQPPQPQFAQPTGQGRTSSPNPFLNMSNTLGNALPTRQQPQSQFSNSQVQQQQFPQRTGGGGGSNPFFSSSTNSNGYQSQLQPQSTGFQQYQQLQPQVTGYGQPQQMRPQLTGFAGGGGGGNTNPFLMMASQNQNQTGGGSSLYGGNQDVGYR